MTSTYFTVDGLSVRKGKRRILEGVSFSRGLGTVTAIIGPNGAGKSTLLRCLAGLEKAAQGHILIDGRALSDYSAHERARLIAFVPQEGSFPWKISVSSFLRMSRYPHESGLLSYDDRGDGVIFQIATLLHLTSFLERDMNSLSGGERQRVFLASALVQEPKVLLLDEAASWLDPGSSGEVYELLKEISRIKEVLVIAVTHDVNGAMYYADSLLVMRNGSPVFDGLPSTFSRSDLIDTLYSRRFLKITHPESGTLMILPTNQSS